MNRSHNCEQAIASVKLAKEIGFNNISIDLMYSLPKQSLEEWKKNLDIAFSLEIQHISAYSLTFGGSFSEIYPTAKPPPGLKSRISNPVFINGDKNSMTLLMAKSYGSISKIGEPK